MLRKRVLIAAMAVSAVVVVATACAGSDDDASSDVVRPTRAEYFTRANAVCRERNERFRELAEPADPDDLIQVLESALAIDAEELEELRALTQPRADEPQLEEIFELTEERLELGREALDAMNAGDEPDDDVIRRENELQFEIQTKMGDYGFAGGGDEDECTEAP